MAEQDLTLKIKAVDEASPTIKKVKGETEKLSKEVDKNTASNKKNAASQKDQVGGLKNLSAGFSKLGPVIGAATAAIGAITAVLIKSNAEYGEQNRLNKNLEQTLRNMGFSADQASIQLNKLNNEFDAMSRVTNFDDEALSASFNKLLLVTKDVTEAQKALKVSMDLSATSGKSLEDTSQKVLKAYNGEYMELVELGVITKQQAEEFQKMADKGQATAKVMDILAQKTKGAAENLTEAEKASRDLNANLDSLWETIGNGTDNVLVAFNALIIEMTGGAGVGKGVFEILNDQVKQTTGSIAALLDAIRNKDLETGLKMLYNISSGGSIAKFSIPEPEVAPVKPTFTVSVGPEKTTQPLPEPEKKSSSKSSSGSAKADAARAAAEYARTQFEIEQMMEMNAAKARNEDIRMLEIEQQYQRRLFDLEQQKVSFEQQSALIQLADLEKESEMIELNKQLDQEKLQLQFERQAEARKQGEYERENLIKLHDLREKQRENEVKHQAWLRQQEEARMAATISNINQASGLLQQGLGMIGGESASGLSSIVGGAAQGVTSYFSGNPMGMISGALSIAGGISSLFGQGDAARLEEERRKREEEQRKAFEAAKRERVEFQKSLQSAIVDALRESRDNLAVTYIINQSGNYLGNDNASLRQVQSALSGTGRLERNRT